MLRKGTFLVARLGLNFHENDRSDMPTVRGVGGACNESEPRTIIVVFSDKNVGATYVLPTMWL